MMYALILAGGSGTRLWPYSRTQKPKQFLSLNGQRTMLQETVTRTLPIIPTDHVYVATNRDYTALVLEQIDTLPHSNVLAEPLGRGTAPCVGLAALHLLRRDPNAVMVVLSADHHILHTDRLCETIQRAAEVAQEGYLVTLGVTPTMPSTGYGYIQRGNELQSYGQNLAFAVKSFAEKPDLARAQAYLDSGCYYWNAGMFVWRADRILEEIGIHRPLLAHGLQLIDAAIGTADEQETLDTIWRELENVAIDVAVMERTKRAAVLPVDLGWNDVGDWSTLASILPSDTDGNVIIGQHVGIDTHDSLIFSNERVIATIGLSDLVVVDTDDVLMICPRARVQEVKDLVHYMRRERAALT